MNELESTLKGVLMNKTDEQLAEEARRFFGGKTPAEEFSESHEKWVKQGRDA